jgi:hypothetical protein
MKNNKDIEAIIILIEVEDSVIRLIKRFPKSRSLRKLLIYLDRMNACYFIGKDYDATILVGIWIMKIVGRFDRFWLQGERQFKYNKKNKIK